MSTTRNIFPTRTPLIATLLFGALVLSACESTEQLREARLQEDSQTCEAFTRGSADFGGCMLAQQDRRDNQALDAQISARLNAEQARDNVETLARIRCEREAKRDRDEGRRPRRCS